MSRQRHDSHGNPITLDTLCRREPAWAASRIELLEAERGAATARADKSERECERLRELARLAAVERDRYKSALERLPEALESVIRHSGHGWNLHPKTEQDLVDAVLERLALLTPEPEEG